MGSIALIVEGITDQVVLEAILCRVFEDEPDINYIQPALDVTDLNRQENYGGWENVFAWCASSEKFEQIFVSNDLLIIHLDTDCCEHANFGVSRRSNGAERSTAELVIAVREVVIERIGQPLFEKYSARIAFAIAVNSIECWLLPFYVSGSNSTNIINCEAHLQRSLVRRNIKFAKDARAYRQLTKEIDSVRDLSSVVRRNESMSLFIESIQFMKATLTGQPLNTA